MVDLCTLHFRARLKTLISSLKFARTEKNQNYKKKRTTFRQPRFVNFVWRKVIAISPIISS